MSLYLHRSNQTKLLRRKAVDRCKYCGTPIEWFERYDTLRIPLSTEFPAPLIPPKMRWHLSKGVAYPGGDPQTKFCRIPHPAICPAVTHPDLPDELRDVVARLAVRMRGRIERGEFAPYLEPVEEVEAEIAEPDVVDTIRHVVSYYGTLRIAPGEVHDLQCIATDRKTGQRCEGGVFDLDDGKWEEVEIPHAPGRQGQQILSETGGRMWAWAVNDFELLRRWWKQRCIDHFRSSQPDHVPFEVVLFHPLKHADYILTARPEGYERTPKGDQLVVHDGPTKDITTCAAASCRHSTLGKMADGWLCWSCERTERRRARVHRRWQYAAEAVEEDTPRQNPAPMPPVRYTP
ncbi:DUF6083 domain-containing protein [Streptomyces zaomyceticus]|uniref:DUF6083 domain-containing protein n=1 Tax=Streptomyces zaomyceticus TaxID=68286 RepID=UPI00367AF281